MTDCEEHKQGEGHKSNNIGMPVIRKTLLDFCIPGVKFHNKLPPKIARQATYNQTKSESEPSAAQAFPVQLSFSESHNKYPHKKQPSYYEQRKNPGISIMHHFEQWKIKVDLLLFCLEIA